MEDSHNHEADDKKPIKGVINETTGYTPLFIVCSRYRPPPFIQTIYAIMEPYNTPHTSAHCAHNKKNNNQAATTTVHNTSFSCVYEYTKKKKQTDDIAD